MSIHQITHTLGEFLAAQPGVPNPGVGEAPPGAAKLLKILGWAAWVVFLCCVGGILIVSGKMAISHKRGMGGGEEASNLMWPLIAAIVGASASGIIGTILAVQG
ncbi:hypothetical protein SAMN04488074_13617 [Lentzea albidocapillata subsp. violacea]|uniref:Uncharacterized protein n=1 Tax=Lentzea albidocapillata subsp. violacea TaxID=128104 RepID=A0A1G9YX53_9PSEU|nr:hypothetical protein [Lentzea albidocapillata]SDN13749.1 hypothetical protein SAMN04488074_13617 [Lentzea albidocapillata subsp. violacea]